VAGDPIAQVRAPGVWSRLFEHNGLNAVCLPFHVRPPDLSAFFGGIRPLGNLVGLIVTIPHKPVVLGLVDEVSPRAAQIGACNAVAVEPSGRTRCDMFDGVGFVAGLRASGQSVRGRQALLVGSGGVGSAIAFGLADAGVDALSVSDVIAERAEALAARLMAAGYRSAVSAPDPAGFDLVVNASPAGMHAGDPLPFDVSRVDPTTIVGDVVISHEVEVTPLVIAARERGCFVQPGTVMTDHQIAEMARFFGFQSGDWSADTIGRLTA
jgi:shikimate dehydrogenase